MDAGDIISIGRQTVWIIIKTSVPILLVSMIVGLIKIGRASCRERV